MKDDAKDTARAASRRGTTLGLLVLAGSLAAAGSAASAPAFERGLRAQRDAEPLDDLGRAELEEALARSERTALLYGELIAEGVVSASSDADAPLLHEGKRP